MWRDILAGHALDPPPKFVQPCVIAQDDPNSCGYRALFNSCVILSHLQEGPSPQKTDLEKLLINQESYNNYVNHWLSLLLLKVEECTPKKYPWKMESVQTMILERLYAKYLAENDFKYLHALGPQSFTFIAEFSLDSMLNGVFMEEEHLSKLKLIFSRFSELPSLAHAFLVGTTGHWVSIVLHKCDHTFSGYLLDSRNYLTIDLDLNREEDQSTIHKMVTTYIAENPIVDMDDRERINRHKQAVQDICLAIRILWACGTNQLEIDTILASMAIEGFIDSFDIHVHERSQLLPWLTDWYHPATAESLLVPKLKSLPPLLLTTQTKLDRWLLATCLLLGSEQPQTGLEERFFSVFGLLQQNVGKNLNK